MSRLRASNSTAFQMHEPTQDQTVETLRVCWPPPWPTTSGTTLANILGHHPGQQPRPPPWPTSLATTLANNLGHHPGHQPRPPPWPTTSATTLAAIAAVISQRRPGTVFLFTPARSFLHAPAASPQMFLGPLAPLRSRGSPVESLFDRPSPASPDTDSTPPLLAGGLTLTRILNRLTVPPLL